MMSVESLLYAVLVLIAAGYWLFFKKFFSELGKQTAELSTLSQRTKVVEESQIRVAQEIEPIKAALSRKNIAFQIRRAEFERLRFEKLDQLYAKLYDLQKYSKAKLFTYADDRELEENKKGFMDRYWQTEDAYFLSLIYLDDATTKATLDLLNQCFSTYGAFLDFYYSDQNRPIFRNFQPSETLINKNIAALDRFNESIQRFPDLLTTIRTHVQKSLNDDNGG